MMFDCCDKRRRSAVIEHPLLNGIDYLEVLDRNAPATSPRQRTLMLRLLKPVPADIDRDNIAIIGGERIRNPEVQWVGVADMLDPLLASAQEIELLSNLDQADHVLIIRTFTEGDFSDYTLRLQRSDIDLSPPENFDPMLADIHFSFKVECAGDFDCRENTTCTQVPEPQADINYLARDYTSFRQLIFDRFARLMPDWRQRNAADLGVTLAEVLAYIGDQMSYWQDAVTTEAYLHTARRRTSLRRHALLVDYAINEGRNARTWLHITVTGGPIVLSKQDNRFLTQVQDAPVVIAPGSIEETQARQQKPLVFEPLTDCTLFTEHNSLFFYTWGDSRCCLNKGATVATLLDHKPHLQAGDFLLFEEVLGPLSGEAGDADPKKRHIVRLTQVVLTEDPLNNQVVTQIYWQHYDALPFALCISSQTDSQHVETTINNVSVARANLVLVDHGETIVNESLGEVAPPRFFYPTKKDSDHCNTAAKEPIPMRFRPRLNNGPLVFAAPPPDFSQNAMRASHEYLLPDSGRVMPAVIALQGNEEAVSQPWSVRRDLFNSNADDHHFVVETENDASAWLRFGDDRNGRRPNSGTQFIVDYRVGGGAAGNVGVGAISHIISNEGGIEAVTNPLAAIGGMDAETAQQIRRRAPEAFRTQQRAVTPSDYAHVTERFTDVQQAVGNLRWTGSWHTVVVTVDREGGELLDNDYENTLLQHVDRYRMAGHDLAFNNPVFVSIELDLRICVAHGYFRSDVEQGLRARLTNGWQPNGKPGLFHPDNFRFAQTLYLSPIYAAARQVPGVSSVQITRFHRQGNEDPKPLADGYLKLAHLEVARLDNDRNFPEHGVMRLQLIGGK